MLRNGVRAGGIDLAVGICQPNLLLTGLAEEDIGFSSFLPGR